MAITFYGMHASPCFFHTITTVSDAMYRQQNVIPLRNNFQCIGKNMAECNASKCDEKNVSFIFSLTTLCATYEISLFH